MSEAVKPKKVRNDIILVAALLVIAAAGFILMNSLMSEGDVAVISVDGVEVDRFPLSEDIEQTLDQYEGSNAFKIANGKVWMAHASCPDQICVHHRPISKVGETIVCLPNKVVISIEKSSTDGGLDASA